MTLLTTHTTDHVTTLTLNRPETMNPLGASGDGDAFAAACDAINADLDVRCVILTGAGRAFSAGGDIKAMKERTGTFGGTAPEISDGYRNSIHKVLRALYGLRVPLIAAVNGPAIGLGCDLACLADMRIASDKAKFGVTFLLGIIPAMAAPVPRITAGGAAELFYTGDVIDAATAQDWGPSAACRGRCLMDEARALAGKVAAMPPRAAAGEEPYVQGRSVATTPRWKWRRTLRR